jgi:plasmid segregation protein ParM
LWFLVVFGTALVQNSPVSPTDRKKDSMEYPIYAYGHDFGNSETCAVLIAQSGRFEKRIPSVASIGSWRKVIATARGAGREVEDILAPHHYVLEYDNPMEGRRVEKYIGQKVFDDGAKPLDTHGDSARYWTNNYNLEMLMTSAASMIPQHEFGLHVVTGLPISIYLDDTENAERVRRSLLGTHVFSLNGIQRVMHVEGVKVIMEGAGALIAYGSNHDVLQGVIDIGGRTTDLYVARGQKPRPANSKGFPLGVASAAARFSEKFRDAFHYTPSFEMRMDLLRQHVAGVPYRSINDKYGIRIPDERLRALIDTSLREIGQEIATQVSAAWDDVLLEFETILLVGGGAHYFATDIAARLRKAHTTPKPELANAAGYASLADAVLRRAQVQALNRRGA